MRPPLASLFVDNRPVIDSVERVHSFSGRLVGLLGRVGLGAGKAIYLAPCCGVRTWFMRFHLDLVFLSKEGAVVHIVRNVAPFRCIRGGRGAYGVIELEAGWLSEEALRVGDAVTWSTR